MNMNFKQYFLDRWNKYFPGSDLPIVLYYSNDEKSEVPLLPEGEDPCVIGNLIKVRKGKSIRFSVETIGCGGGKRYLGITQKLRPNFNYFLSCGIPGEIDGERYKKSPELVEVIAPPEGIAMDNPSGRVVPLVDGRLLLPLESWKAWDDTGPIKQRSLAVFSTDGGHTWGEHVTVAMDPEYRFLYWNGMFTRLEEGDAERR